MTVLYGDAALIRKLMGGLDPTVVSDADIAEFQAYGTATVQSETAKTDWQSTDIQWPMVNEATNYFASSRGREMFTDKDNVAEKHYQRALDIVARLVVNAALGTQEPGLIVKSSAYVTFPLNPTGKIYRSGFATGNYGVGDPLIPT